LIPKLHYISEGSSSKEVLENIQKACTSGIEIVQLKLENTSEKKFLKLANEVKEITAHFQTRLIINKHYKIAKEIKADGVHLDKNHNCPKDVRENLYTWQIIGGTANTLKDCEILIKKEIDYIILSPFRKSDLEDNSIKTLGLNGFTLIKEALQTETPILGFGRITTNDVSAILKTGISGIAVSEEITRNFDNIKSFNQLLKASSTEELRHKF
jgi:thiamine-phosphate pyrophosphorylase